MIQSVPSTAARAGSGNKSLNRLLAVAIWVRILYAGIDFDNFSPPDLATSTAAQAAAQLANMTPNPATRLLKLALIAIGVLVIGTHVRQTRALLRQLNVFFMITIGLATASVLWSADPSATIARLVGLAATVLICFAFCLSGWYRNRMQDVVRPLLTLLLVGSLIFGILEPRLAIDNDAQAGWHGLEGQKNPFGQLAALGALMWMYSWISGEMAWPRALAGAAVSWTCLILSKSSTSFIATFFATNLMLMMLRMSPAIRRYSPYIVGVFASILLTYALAVLKLIPGLDTLLLGPITAMTGKDMTFSNRSIIWEIIKEHAQYNPILGTGYGAYWTGPVPTSPSYVFLGRMYFWPSESHNGYLEMVNDLGFVGLICLICYLIVYIRQSLRLFKTDRAQGAFFLALFFQEAFTNLSESTWFSANGIMNVCIMTLATCALARSLQEQQRLRKMQTAAVRAPPPVMPRIRSRF